MATSRTSKTPHKNIDFLSSVLFNLLLQMVAGPDYRTTLDDNGIDTLRLLREQLGEMRRQTMISTLMRTVLQKLEVIDWEFDISEYKILTTERLPYLVTAALLITKTRGDVHHDLVHYC